MHLFVAGLFETIKLSVYVQYVDDSFVLLYQHQLDIDLILTTMNSIDSCIQFTFKNRENNRLAFLDVLIIIDSEYFLITVYRKTHCCYPTTPQDIFISSKCKKKKKKMLLSAFQLRYFSSPDTPQIFFQSRYPSVTLSFKSLIVHCA